MIAQSNDIVTCARGHPLYRVATRTIPDDMREVRHFEPIHPKAERPQPERMAGSQCPICGALWVRWGHAGLMVHFEDGWR